MKAAYFVSFEINGKTNSAVFILQEPKLTTDPWVVKEDNFSGANWLANLGSDIQAAYERENEGRFPVVFIKQISKL